VDPERQGHRIEQAAADGEAEQRERADDPDEGVLLGQLLAPDQVQHEQQQQQADGDRDQLDRVSHRRN
jgi:hypothetical protein